MQHLCIDTLHACLSGISLRINQCSYYRLVDCVILLLNEDRVVLGLLSFVSLCKDYILLHHFIFDVRAGE